MMSNPPQSVLQQRQRLHRRQNSTPVAFEALKVPTLSPAIQCPIAHRRGQSLDQRSPIRGQQQHRPTPTTTTTTGSTVSITNPGSTTTTTIGQQILREAQQQKLARPGQPTNQSAVMSPQCGGTFLDQTIDQNESYNATARNESLPEQARLQVASPLQQYLPSDFYMPSSAGLEGMNSNVDENSQHCFQSAHSVRQNFEEEMMNGRSMSQPDLQMYAQQRPVTPAQQMNSAQLPLTPAATPFKQNMHQHQFSRTAQSSPVRRQGYHNSKAPHPTLMQRGRSLEGIFEGPDHDKDTPSPPGTAPLRSSRTFEMAEMPLPQSMSSHAVPMTFSYSNESHASLQVSSKSAMTASDNTFPAGPEDPRTPLFGELGSTSSLLVTNIPIPFLPSSQPGTSCPPSPTKTELSPRRMSISDLNLEPGVSASIEETNITLDDIAQFIEMPGPNDNKWVCKYEDCNKKFGRKENIKSHIQTHLGDRQFRCDHCNKCFVRGHDLKRHAKIHTGSKPYPCLCGNAFARHDALTRHRQRGNCIGAFEGVVKKIVKKGRPRKHRPEMDDRVEKAKRTRQRVEERDGGEGGVAATAAAAAAAFGHDYYASSSFSTDSSTSGFNSPPTETLDSLSIRGASPLLDDMSLFGVVVSSHPTHHHHHQTLISEPNAAFPPDLFTFTPPASPTSYSTGNKPSPSTYYRALTPTDMAEMPEMIIPSSIPTHQLLSAISHQEHQHHNSPPSLCHSSSSPLPDVVSFDFGSVAEEAAAAVVVEREGQRLSLLKGEEGGGGGGGGGGEEFDSFFDYGNMSMDAGGDGFFDL